MRGWSNRIAWIDLTTNTVQREKIPAEWYFQFLGGRGLGTRLLYELTDEHTDPLSCDNPLIVTAGPVTGTLMPTSGRYHVSALSPLTGILGDGNAAGFFAPALKYAGLDGLVITGEASTPVYIWIHNERISICPAEKIWGMDTWDAAEALRQKTHPCAEIACIGPAGENRVSYATIMNNSKRAIGRCGMGAVMGGKKLKGLAVYGTGSVKIFDPEGHRKNTDEMITAVRDSAGYPLRSKFGTTAITDVYHRMGTMPVRNSQAGWAEETEKLSANAIVPYTIGRKSCFACPIHCSRFTRVSTASGDRHEVGEGPEFETIAALGARCGNFNLPAVLRMNHQANRLGLDTISLGGVLSFMMECRQKGLIASRDLDGLNLAWGETEAMETMIDRIASRKGCGDWLAKGVRALSAEIPGSEDFAIHVKGLEAAEQEPRGMKAWGLGWAVASRGADHLRAFPLAETTWTSQEALEKFGTDQVVDPLSYEGKAALVKWSEEVSALCDSLSVCKFFLMAMSIPTDLVVEGIYAVTGMPYTWEELLTAGERMVNLERMFNIRRGLTRDDDRLPKRFEEPLVGGPRQGETFILENMLEDYYKLRGWDPATGIPENDTLSRLDLDFVK